MKKKPIQRRYKMKEQALNQSIDALIKKAGNQEDAEFLREIIVTALKLGEDALERKDIKLINSAMKELRYGLKVFHPYQHVRKVAVFGSARTQPASQDYKLTVDFSHRIVKEGWMVITGAAAGIMEAGNEGAGRANSFGVNIRLPFEQAANPHIYGDPKLVNFKYFFTRKLIFVAESDATLLCPGGFGTHDEGFETLTLVQTGKATPRPIVCLDPPRSNYWKRWRRFLKEELGGRGMIDKRDLNLIDFTHDPEEAVEIIRHFYRNYHSMRYVGDLLVIRLRRPIGRTALKNLNKQFSDIVVRGKITQRPHALEEEAGEVETFDLTRLIFYFDRYHYARLHELVKAINEI